VFKCILVVFESLLFLFTIENQANALTNLYGRLISVGQFGAVSTIL